MDNFDILRKSYEDYLVGEKFDPNSQDGKQIVSSVDLVVSDSLEAPRLKVPYFSPVIHIRALAAAFRTPGSSYCGKKEVLEEILQRLGRLNESYNMQTPPEDWWVVQVGNPLRILDILILLYDYLEEKDELVKHWTDTILHFQNSYMLTSHGKPETGANMMWKCHVYILMGILRKDQSLIDWAQVQLPKLLCYSHKISHPQAGTFFDDGFYPDGSFIQHYFFAYTGGYGKHFINILSGLLYAFRNTELSILDENSVKFFCEMVYKAYAPLIVDGRFMDVARGRESSRYNNQDYICGRNVMRALCYLAEAVLPEDGRKIRALLKLWLSQADNRLNICVDEDAFAEYYVNPSLAEVLNRLDRDNVTMAPQQYGHYNFGPMCKTVHRHGGWSAAISMYSPATACYEYLNGESVKFWHMSDGVLYLYTADADQYNGGYYATADMQRLPGTTVDRSPERARDPYYNWFMPESKNVYDFAGGSALGNYGIAGMQFCGQGKGKERNLEARKSWFFLGEEIVCVGSGISSSTGNPIETIVLNQRLTDRLHQFLTIGTKKYSCQELGAEINIEGTILHLDGNKGTGSDVGVVFPKGGDLHILCEHRRGTWNNVNINPECISENDFATVWLDHGTHPQNAEYSYILLPGASNGDTVQYAKAPDVEILECSSAVHAVRNKVTGMLGCNFWEDKQAACAGILVSTQASVIIQKEEKKIRLAVSDPAQRDRMIHIELNCNASEVVMKEEGIRILSMAPLKIIADTTGRNGQSLNLVVKC